MPQHQPCQIFSGYPNLEPDLAISHAPHVENIQTPNILCTPSFGSIFLWPYLTGNDFSDLDWSEECKNIIRTREHCKETIMKLSSKYYWSNITLSDCHMRDIPDLCHTYSKLGHVYWLMFLRDLCSKQINIVDSKPHTGLYNMTNQYYASIVLEFLNRHFLKKIWSETRENQQKFTPERLAIFFSQWMQPESEKFDSSFDAAMTSIIKIIKDSLSSDHPLHRIKAEEIQKWSNESISENKYEPDSCMEVIKLSIDVLKNVGLFSNADHPTFSLFIQDIFKNKNGNCFYNTTILEAILRRCGVRVEYDFTNFLTLLWKENWKSESKVYVIEHYGKIAPRNILTIKNEYNSWQKSFLFTLTHLARSSRIKKYDIMDQRALELMQFLEPENVICRIELINMYSSLKKDIRDLFEKQPSSKNFRLQNFRNYLKKECDMLSKAERHQKLSSFKISIKHHFENIQLAVGLMCYHKLEGYLCVVHGWDDGYVPDDESEMIARWDGENQPFYHVLFFNGTQKYVPQEHLILAIRYKLLKFEYKTMGKHFSHFDGYVFIPNVEKEKEYPEDGLVRDKYRNVTC